MNLTEYKKIRNKIGTIVMTLSLEYNGFDQGHYGVDLYVRKHTSPSREEANEIADKILEKLDIKPDKKVHSVK